MCEFKSAAYNSAMKRKIKDGSTMKLGVKFVIWITCGAKYKFFVAKKLLPHKNM